MKVALARTLRVRAAAIAIRAGWFRDREVVLVVFDITDAELSLEMAVPCS